MQSRIIAFCCGTVAGLGGAMVLYGARPKLSSEEDKHSASHIFKYGYPEVHISPHSYTAHSLSYDRARRIPVWVAESINKDMVSGKIANRKNSHFQPDPKLPQEYCSSNTDYHGSGWSRGHMAPAGNYKHCQHSMDDTFYLTNIVPQNIDNNTGYWNSIEDYCRRLSKKYSQVNVISGPLFLPLVDLKSKKKFVKYEVIGENNVAVPTHLYKIILVEEEGESSPMLGAFVVPNEPIKDVGLKQFQVSLEEVERFTGTKFHCKLNRSETRDLCTADGCKIKSYKEWIILGYKKSVQAAASHEELEKLWKEVTDKGVHHDQDLRDLYSQKKANFEGQVIS